MSGAALNWRRSVEDILQPLTAEAIACALGIPDATECIADRLDKLRWIGLVSDSFIEAQTAQCEWGEGTAYTNRWHGNPFENRMGGCPESKYYMRPRQVLGGGVVESFGVYTEAARTYGAAAFMKHRVVRISVEDSDTLGNRLPSAIGDEAMILISPEMVCGLAL